LFFSAKKVRDPTPTPPLEGRGVPSGLLSGGMQKSNSWVNCYIVALTFSTEKELPIIDSLARY
jgi:hypothetical protein